MNASAAAAKFKKNPLGSAPKPHETQGNITAPEEAPAAARPAEPPAVPPSLPPVPDAGKMDGRSLRATGRTSAISTRITKRHKALIYNLAKKHNLMIAEIIERGAEALQNQMEGRTS